MLFIIAVAPKSCRSAVLVGRLNRARPEAPWFPKQHSRQTTTLLQQTAAAAVELQLDLSQHFATSSRTGLTSTIGKETERAENASPLGNIDLIDSSTVIAVAQISRPPQRTNINKISDGGGAKATLCSGQAAEPKTSCTAVWLFLVAI
jgi:hypothetical protein